MMEWIISIGERYPADSLEWVTRLQCFGWTSADIVIVFSILQLANTCRSSLGLRLHRVSYLVLIATLFFVPVIFFARTGLVLFWVEVIVTVPHFLLIIYVLAANVTVFPQFLAKILAQQAAQDKG